MSFPSYLGVFAIAAAVFLAIDLVWLGVIAKKLYAHFMGDLLAEQPIWPAALLFYVVFIVGLIYFAIGPALASGSLRDAAVKGALYGLFTYATYDLTNLAVLKGYPLGIVPIDIAWGVVLASGVSVSTWSIWRHVT